MLSTQTEMHSGSLNMMQNFPYAWKLWYLAFKITKKSFFVKIEVWGKNANFKIQLKILILQNKFSLVKYEIFLCIFTYIWKYDIFSTYLNFDEKWIFGHFKSQISKCPNISKMLLYVSAPTLTPSLSTDVILKNSYSGTPCITYFLYMIISWVAGYWARMTAIYYSWKSSQQW